MRICSALLMAVAAITGMAVRAFAHEEITPKVLPAGQAAFLTLTVANEASSDLIRIVLKAPAELPFGEATQSPAGWSAAATGTTATWTGGALRPGTFETFGFEIEGRTSPAHSSTQ